MKRNYILFLSLALSATCLLSCRREAPTPDINLEQVHRPAMQHIMAPGMGTIGIISNGYIDIYYFDESGEWLPDHASRFTIPENNSGMLAMGMGTIAVVHDQMLHFYRPNAFNRWQEEDYLQFSPPSKYDRLTVMKMPWEIGVIAIETDGILEFYFFYDDTWQHDPTASFVIPPGISEYYPAGDMTIAVIDQQKLGLYFLGPEEGWEFMDHEALVLLLPDGYTGIMPYDRHKISVLVDNSLHFFAIDLEHDRWISLNELQFDLPF